MSEGRPPDYLDAIDVLLRPLGPESGTDELVLENGSALRAGSFRCSSRATPGDADSVARARHGGHGTRVYTSLLRSFSAYRSYEAMGPTKTILVVQDDHDAQFVLVAILNHDGYHIVDARSGEEAVELARRLIPDLILTDIRLPGMSGFEVARQLRADEGTRNIPVVALTSEGLEDRSRAARARALFHSILQKPIQPKALAQHIRTIIGRP